MIGRRRNGFTLVDLMIVIVILGVLAAIVLPLVTNHLEQAQLTAAQSSLFAVEKAIEMHWMQNNTYPAALTDLNFQASETLTLPQGYSFNYDNTTGTVVLVTP